MAQIPRLYIDHDLAGGQTVTLSREHAHYLFSVLRLGAGAAVDIFNGRDGVWRAEVAEAGKKGGTLTCQSLSAPQHGPPDLWLLFAPVKKAQTDFIVEKSVELGAARLCPVLTEFTNSERVRRDKMGARVIEAAEQCGISYVPEVAEPQRLSALLDRWPSERHLMFCDETARGAATVLADLPPGPWAILIGPEGGFSETERQRLTGLAFAHRVSLGPRILRAETAAAAALTLWQSALGDWQ